MLVIRGQVDNWRRDRMHSYLVHASLVETKNRVNMLEAMPLPFDDELSSNEMSESDVEKTMRDYEEAQKLWSEHDPFKK